MAEDEIDSNHARVSLSKEDLSRDEKWQLVQAVMPVPFEESKPGTRYNPPGDLDDTLVVELFMLQHDTKQHFEKLISQSRGVTKEKDGPWAYHDQVLDPVIGNKLIKKEEMIKLFPDFEIFPVEPYRGITYQYGDNKHSWTKEKILGGCYLGGKAAYVTAISTEIAAVVIDKPDSRPLYNHKRDSGGTANVRYATRHERDSW